MSWNWEMPTPLRRSWATMRRWSSLMTAVRLSARAASILNSWMHPQAVQSKSPGDGGFGQGGVEFEGFVRVCRRRRASGRH